LPRVRQRIRAAIPDCRFVDPHEHKTSSDYFLVNLFEIPALVWRIEAAG